jgi:uncharacterized protein (DUF2342 family)
MIATQLGQAIGAISSSAVGAHDAGLPILEPARPLLIPENIDLWGADTEIAKTEVYLFHALREGAIARLFEHNPWIVSYIRSAIVEYGAGIKIDLEAIQRQAEEAMSNGANEISIALDAGVFTPEETPAQRAALSKLETVFQSSRSLVWIFKRKPLISLFGGYFNKVLLVKVSLFSLK